MPRLRDIELFKTSIRSLGKEAETLERWGEVYEEAAPLTPAPSEGSGDGSQPDLAGDLADLLDLGTQPGDGQTAAGNADDFSSFLNDLSLDDLPDAENAAGGETPGTDDGFLVPDEPSFGEPSFQDSPAEPAATDGPDPDVLEPFEEPFSLDVPEPGETAGSESQSSPEGADDFGSLPESLLAGLEGDLSGAADERPADGEPGTTDLTDAPEEATFPPDDFSMPEFESAEAPAEDFTSEEPGFEIGEEADTPPDAGTLEPSPAPDVQPQSADEVDAFSSFDLGGEAGLPDFADIVPEMGEQDFAPAANDIDSQLASLEGDTSVSETFSLDSGWGGDFSIPGFETPVPAAGKAPLKAPLAGPTGQGAARSQGEKVRAVSLTDAQVDILQDTLLSYPLNVRLAVEDVIANARGTEQQQSALIWMLVERAQPRDAAKLAGKVLKRFIEVPAGFEKRTGAAFEEEKGSLAYIFRHSILPILQVVLLAAAGVAALFFLGYNFVYKPLHANALYAEGYRQIGLDKYAESDEFFVRADRVWTIKSWYYRYAAAYAEKAQYPRAELSYDRLLGRWPKETRAALLYARMESETLFAFEKAEKILKRYVLERDYFNKDALLLMADNYLAWADMEEQRRDPPPRDFLASLYENARYSLAMVMEHHGRADAYLERMLVYFMRVERSMGADKLKEIEPLAKYFIEAQRSKFSAATLAELGDYLMARERVDYVGQILVRAVDRDGTLPEAHAAMARWSRRTGFPDDERRALEYAVRFFEEADGRSGLVTKRVRAYLDTLIRLAEIRIAAGESLDAEKALNTAISRYERSLEELRFYPEAAYGKAYSLLAGIYYLERRDFPGALALYATAERNGYSLPETDYRRGYMWYRDSSSDGSAALAFFYRAGLDSEPSPYLLLATGNALYARSDYFAAQGYYSMLADRMQFELDTLSIPSPQVRPTHGEIVELLIMARNNLGATLYRIAERVGDARRRAEAMSQFTESARLYDSMSRDLTTMIRSESKNLGFLNLDFVLHPMRGIDIAVYRNLPVDMKFPR